MLQGACVLGQTDSDFNPGVWKLWDLRKLLNPWASVSSSMKWGDEKNQERERHKVLGSGQFMTRSSWVLIITPVPAPGAAPHPPPSPLSWLGPAWRSQLWQLLQQQWWGRSKQPVPESTGDTCSLHSYPFFYAELTWCHMCWCTGHL